jgi:DNA-directed RNA polymerase specialized sigma24 family protein
MLSARQTAKLNPSTYPIEKDFCRVFEQNMDSLYRLAFLLTANQHMAEECFARGLEDAARSNRVFKEWAEAWAQRMVIQGAIEMVQPHSTDNSAPTSRFNDSASDVAIPPQLAAVVDLPAFERFAFVMSVLERYSDQECSVLLGRTRGEVAAARSRALQQLGSAAEFRRKQISSGSVERIRDVRESALERNRLSRIAVTA